MPAATVYCASSTTLEPAFHDCAKTVGTEIARHGWSLIFGGGSVGLMGEVADAAQHHGAHVTGIITTYLHTRELAREHCDELIVVDTMRERKRLLAEQADAFLILPGGIGTYEEFFEVLVGRKLEEHNQPIGIVNLGGYYDPLIAMIDHGVEHRFIGPEIRDLFLVGSDPASVVKQVLRAAAPAATPPHHSAAPAH